MRLAEFHAHREPIGARRQLRPYRRFPFNMAETVSSAAQSAWSQAGRTNAGSPEEEESGDDAQLLRCQIQLGAPRGEDNAELVTEAEAVAAGWMLDFLCLSLCRAFRDGRSEDFRLTRDCAEGECGLPASGAASRPETGFPSRNPGGTAGERPRHRPDRAKPAASYLLEVLASRPHPFHDSRQNVCFFKDSQPSCYRLLLGL